MRVALFYPSVKGGVSRRVEEIQSRSKYDVSIVYNHEELDNFDIVHSYSDFYFGDVHTCASYLRQSIDYFKRGSRYALKFFGKGIKELYSLRKFPFVVSRSKAEFDFLKRRGIDSTLIRAGVDTDVFMPLDVGKKSNNNENLKRILFVGRLEDAKGLRLLMKAMEYLPVECRLMVIGEGPLSRVAMSNPKVSMCNWVSHKDIIEHFQMADVFCLPSYTECFPLSVLEALACNLPVVAPDVGDIKDMIEPPNGGYICSYDPRDIAQKIQEALIPKEEFQGRNLALKFPWSNTISNVEGLWEMIIKNK